MKKLLETRKKLKAKKPDFIRQDTHKKKKVRKKKWRKPKGGDSKMRLNLKGYRRSVSKGWRSPKAIRGSNSDGLKEVIVSNINDLNKINNEEIAVLSSNLGKKKLAEILTKAKELKIEISNHNIDKRLDAIKAYLDENKKIKAEKAKKAKEKESKAKKDSKNKEGLDSKISEDEKKDKEKKEKDKLLTKKEI